MNTLETAPTGHPSHRCISFGEHPLEYVVTLDVSDFVDDELAVEVTGRQVVVRGDRSDAGFPLAVHERFEEAFRIPDDADDDRVSAVYKRGTLEVHARRRKAIGRRVPIERDYLAGDVPKGC